MGSAGDVRLASDILHLLAAGAWLGGLLPLALLYAKARDAGDPSWAAIARAATLRFSMLGLISDGTLVLTGCINTWFLVGSVSALIGSDYGRLLLLKLCFFAAMVALAAVNRLRLTPRLITAGTPGPSSTVLRRLQRNSLLEAGRGLAVLFAVGALGTTMPAMSE
ncbi:MAG TPA: CopD family protein [Stellaceae bacterium]|nr:CopD family protein [Stellaceae bacterium]